MPSPRKSPFPRNSDNSRDQVLEIAKQSLRAAMTLAIFALCNLRPEIRKTSGCAVSRGVDDLRLLVSGQYGTNHEESSLYEGGGNEWKPHAVFLRRTKRGGNFPRVHPCLPRPDQKWSPAERSPRFLFVRASAGRPPAALRAGNPDPGAFHSPTVVGGVMAAG